MRIWNYNTEKKDPIPTELYFKFGLIGLVCGVLLIVIGISLKFFFGIVIKYWLWILGVLAAVLVLRRIFRRKVK